MLARSNKLNHPLGIEIETPLLIPSFSSKGFSFNNRGESEANGALTVSKEFLTESLLISAYDIFHGHFPVEDDYTITDLTVIDSGGYETSGFYDLSATTKHNYPIKDWSQDNLEEVLNRFPMHKAAVIVSFDHGQQRHPLDLQIEQANRMFSKYPDYLFDFLIKPETDEQKYIQLEDILTKVKRMTKFSIIGVTEKELGNSVLRRMINIYKLRSALDSTNHFAPIHVFGSLDPITSILYFFAGAEIFDGLTWLKYSYFDGPAVYQSNYGVLHNDLGIHVKDSQVRAKSLVNNVYFLDRMKYTMKEFVSCQDFNIFDDLADGLGTILKRSYDKFKSNLK